MSSHPLGGHDESESQVDPGRGRDGWASPRWVSCPGRPPGGSARDRGSVGHHAADTSPRHIPRYDSCPERYDQPDRRTNAGNPADVQWIEPYYAMVSKDKNGKVNSQHYGEKGTTARDIRAENSIDGVVALLGERSNKSDKNREPVSGAGASRAGISSANMSEMQNLLMPGNTALILVVPHPAVADVTSELKQADASQVYDAPLVVVPAQ
jgi:hypothetical protein